MFRKFKTNSKTKISILQDWKFVLGTVSFLVLAPDSINGDGSAAAAAGGAAVLDSDTSEITHGTYMNNSFKFQQSNS